MELLWLEQAACQNIKLVGGKVANLSRLAADYPVPPGFCLTTEAFNRWRSEGQQTVETLPEALQAMLAAAYQTLAERCQVAEPQVAVRSSAIDEDGQGASFAGQYESYLNITGLAAVGQAVLQCWDSVQAERVVQYRQQQGLPGGSVSLAVLVQQFIPADIAGVAFSANPVTGNRDEVVINTSWGLGETIVGGTVTPDTYTVHKPSLSITDRQIADKQHMAVANPTGTHDIPVPRLLRHQSSLTDSQALEIAQLAITLEGQLGWPVDIECAIQADELYLLQCRPVTTLKGV